MGKLIVPLLAVISFGIVLRCMAGSDASLSWEPRWKWSEKPNGESCIRRELPTFKVVEADGDGVVIDWSCTDEQYVPRSTLPGDWEKRVVADGSKNQRRVKLPRVEYFEFEDKCEGCCSRIGDVMSFWRGGNRYGLMEVGYDKVEKVEPRGFASPDLVLKHSVYMATNDMLGCVLKLVCSDKAKPSVYLGTWFVRTDASGDVRLWGDVDSRDGLYSNAVADKNGDVSIYVGRDGVQACYKLQKERMLDYRRIAQSGYGLRTYESATALEVPSLPRRILGADVLWRVESTQDLKQDEFSTAEGSLQVWKDKKPKALPADSPFDTVERMYRCDGKTLCAMWFRREFDLKSNCIDCKKLVEDVANRVFEDSGVFLDFGSSFRDYNLNQKCGINGAGKRRDGIRVSLAMSSEDVNSLVKLWLLVEFDGADSHSQASAVRR